MTEFPDVVTGSADYARRFDGPVGQWFLARQESAVLRLVADLTRGATALDVGGGHGQLAPGLARTGFEVTVLGSAADAGQMVQPLVRNGLCRFEAGSLAHLPFPDQSFDLVCSVRLLAHTADWQRLIRELCRVARRAVVIDYASSRSVNITAQALFGVKRRVEGDTRRFLLQRPGEVAATFREAGFAIVAAVPQFVFPMALHRRLPLGAARALEWGPRVIGLTAVIGSPVVARADRSGPRPPC